MSTTKYKIAEQILLRISSGYTEKAAGVQIQEIIIAVGQKANAYLKLQYFSGTLPSGETIPDGCMLGEYSSDVVKYGKKSSCVLPTMPMMLPRNLGVYEVSDKEDFSNLFIPLQNGQAFLLGSQDTIDDLFGNIGYEVVGNKLVFTKDITVQGIKKVYQKLAVSDVDRLSDYDPLPLPADIEALIVDDLVKQFAPSQSTDVQVDSYTTKQSPSQIKQ